MRRIWLTVLLGALLVGAPGAVARDLTGDEYARMLELIRQARIRTATSLLDSLETVCAGEPFFLIARGRLLIEDISIDDMDKEGTKARSQPALAMFEQAIAVCDERLEAGGDEARLRLYRGWAWMVRSQIHAVGSSFWSAGREAGRGKKDLDFYLELYPDEPVANGLLGAFLYFTDAVPDIFQFLSKLVMMPTGDRERGLAMIDRAVAVPSPKQIDFHQLQANVNIFFEGRFETGLPQAEALHDHWPAYARNSLGPVMVRLWAPGRHEQLSARLATTLDAVADLPRADVDTVSLLTARAYDAWADRFLLGPAAAAPRFRALAAPEITDPDWVRGFARLQLAQMACEAGRFDDAVRLAALVSDDERAGPLRDPARELLKALEKGAEADSLPADWIAAVHEAPLADLPDLASRFAARADGSLRAAFYAAECRLRLGDRANAMRLFQQVAAREAPPWLRTYRLIAATRVGDLKAAIGRYRSAARWYDRALMNFQEEYRLDWLLKGRRRYLEELHEAGGTLPGPPALLLGSD